MLNLDLISEKISIRQENLSKHSSIFGLILSIAIGILGISFIIYSLIDLIDRKTPLSNIIIKYEDDVGTYSLDNKSMFHMISHFDGAVETVWKEKALEIRGELYSTQTTDLIAIYKYGHCNWEIDSLYQEVLLNEYKKSIGNNMCIRKYINTKTGETVDLTKNNIDSFPFPSLKHGVQSKNFINEKTHYILKVKYCGGFDGDSSNCDKEQISNYEKISFRYHFKFIDNSVDVTNYENPYQKFVNIVTGLSNNFNSANNYLNFNTFEINTDDSLVFSYYKKSRNYIYQLNEKITIPRTKAEDDIITVQFFLKNQQTIYLRRYKKAQEILASIGGFMNFLHLIALILNFYSNDYQIITNSIQTLKEANLSFKDIHNLTPYKSVFDYQKSSKTYGYENKIMNNNLGKNINIDNSAQLNLSKNNISKDNNFNIEKNNNYIAIDLGQINKVNNEHPNNTKFQLVNEEIGKDENKFCNRIDLRNYKVTFASRMKYISRKLLFMQAEEDLILKLRNSIMNEKTFINQFINLVKMKKKVDAISSREEKDTAINLADIINYY